MLAPGLKCNFTVRFSPDLLADYEDALTVLAESFKFTVELAARRHPPCLTLDATIDVGHVLVGNDVEVRLPFKNVGGARRFRLVAEEDWPDRATPLHVCVEMDSARALGRLLADRRLDARRPDARGRTARDVAAAAAPHLLAFFDAARC